MTSHRPQVAGLRRLTLVAAALLLAACSSSKKSSPPSEEPAPSGTLTLHYHRALQDYAGWSLVPTGGATSTAPVAASSTDAFGAVYVVTTASSASALEFTMRHGADPDAAGTITVALPGPSAGSYVFSGRGHAFAGPLPATPGPSQVVVFYTRRDGSYSGWGLHLWGDQVTETAWTAPLQPAGVHAELGAEFLVTITSGVAGNCPAGKVCVIAHNGENKDPGPDMSFDASVLGSIVFVTSGSAVVTAYPPAPPGPGIVGAAAHLLSRSVLVWDATDPDHAATTFELRWSATAGVHGTATDVVGGSTIALTPDPAALTTALQALAPHLKTRRAFRIATADLPALEQALKGQLVAVARKAGGGFVAATQVQTAFALDDLYPYAGPLGLTFAGGAPTFRIWAPTAQAVRLHVFDAAKTAVTQVDMVAGAQGLWSYTGPAAWYGDYYQYELDVYHPATGNVENVRTSDPWAVSLSTNGRYAQVVDLSDPALVPAGWAAVTKPPLDAFEDVVVYEGHVRDFSVLDPSVVETARRGRYLGFEPEAASTSNGIAHLAALARAGLTHLHLLPAFDFATIDEDPAHRVDVGDLFATLCARNAQVPTATCGQYAGNTILEAIESLAGDSDQQQQIAAWMKDLDSFNWGYDPVHFGVPEGSYASSAEGTTRIVEFRRMVMALARVGIRVVMDVVYNHTNAAGVASPYSVLDKVVPWYYHRLDPDTGAVLSSTCCANTASEHAMMQKLMVDTAVRWARDYKVDGLRLDLMGHHMKSNLLALRAALDALTVPNDGVDGPKVFLYGEGWNFGEVMNDARGVNATQLNMAGTGIGTFNDRIRDAVRGGGPFDSSWDIRTYQGFATGQWFDPNELGTATAAMKTAMLQATDRLKVGMAGNLADFRLRICTLVGDYNRPGSALSYGSNPAQPTGYTQDPQEAINYVSAHDNQDLFDIVQAKLPTGTSMADRVRVQVLALATVALGQGVPFFHMGDDVLRSKSMERNSYDSGDWFNRVDWSGQTCGWRSGLPAASQGQSDWPLARQLFADATIAPTPSDIDVAGLRFQELLRMRKSTPLFRLRTKADVMTRVDFLNTGCSGIPGVVVMTITDGTCAGADLDPDRDAVVVILNADVQSHDLTVPGAGTGTWRLHPELGASADTRAQTSSRAGEVFTVPARTVAVFEQLQGASQGQGLACNSR
jgi:pullulanase-type alpha-1,6-glucosidase